MHVHVCMYVWVKAGGQNLKIILLLKRNQGLILGQFSQLQHLRVLNSLL